ncbi:VanW family protein [Patescibacteria group bacterium]|nr:VanW family protein [Patescibacteria group bacterium]MBU4098419.1 VanW family protein [Patescibacteria group bacterium]
MGSQHKLIFNKILKGFFWFGLGAIIGLFFFVSFLLIFYQKSHKNLIYSGIYVDGIDFGGKTQSDIKNYFSQKNLTLGKHAIEFSAPTISATISGQQIDFGYDEDLLAQQGFLIGRSDNQLSNIYHILSAYFSGINLPPSFHYSPDKLDSLLSQLNKETEIPPVNALFTFENGRVTAFSLSHNGQAVDMPKLKKQVYDKMMSLVTIDKPMRITRKVPIVIVKPAVTNDNVNSFGIRELIGEGTSLFQHSIENRIYNISLAAGRLNGILIPPGDVFSFNKALGDVSSFTGYKQAYVIENGRTVLGDGGGVCQVSTTLFRAALNAGLPIIERNAHAYRVGYYEQDSGPGIDAAVYSPSVDLKFKNDTGNHVLIQSYVDTINLRLTFDLYSTKDNREVIINQPVILSETPAPPPLYQDDPVLFKGVVRQVDFAANGASVYFTRIVKKDGKVILNDKFTSNYRPWQAIFLRGTKE